MRTQYDILIIGGGPAGLAAAVSAREHNENASILIIERDAALGGILQQCIHNGFGLHFFGEELTGPEYAQRFIDKLNGARVDIWTDSMVMNITPDKSVTVLSAQNGFVTLTAKAVILAMGCRERTRGALSIPGTRPAGIYTAGCAQRLVNMEGYLPGKSVVILGSGDIGLIMARRMTWEGASVKLVCELMPYSSGLNRNIVQCLTDNGIPLKFNHTVTRIHGKERVTGVTVSEVDPATRKPIPGTDIFYECDTLLLSVGLIPENDLSVGANIAMDRVTGGAAVDETRQTSVPGIFACGNVLHVHDLVDNVSAESMLAGKSAAEFVKNAPDKDEHYAVTPSGGVRYVVPQRVRKDAAGKLDLYFRVGSAFKPAELTVTAGDIQIVKRKKNVMTPGEMEKITVDANLINDDIIVNVR